MISGEGVVIDPLRRAVSLLPDVPDDGARIAVLNQSPRGEVAGGSDAVGVPVPAPGEFDLVVLHYPLQVGDCDTGEWRGIVESSTRVPRSRGCTRWPFRAF